MRALPQHVPTDLDPRERHGTGGVGRVDDLKLESIGRQIFEGALEVERLERAVRVLARPYLRSVALPVSEHRFPDFRYVWFHAACPRLIAGGLRRGSAESCHQQKQQQRRRDAFTHARSSRGQRAPWCRAGRIRPRCALLTRQTPRTLLLAIEIAGRPEKDFVSWAHACETWEIVMELRHLRYFIAVADAGSLTVAAEQKLHTSQPSLSRQIRDLEDEVGAQLLTRGARGVDLTPAGRAFLDHARSVLSQVEAAGEAARRVAHPAKPCFTMGFLTGHELTWMPEALRILRDELPNIDVMISSQYSPQLADAIVKGNVDAAF